MSTEPDKVETIVDLVVPEGYQENERVDVYITRFLPNVSRSKVQQGVKDGMVSVNARVISRPSHALQAGDVVECRMMRPPPIEALPEDIPLDIRYEDDQLLVIDKAAGMVVHPAYGNRTGTLVNALLHHVGAGGIRLEGESEADESDEEVASDEAPEEIGLSMTNAFSDVEGDVTVRPGIVHRLDKDTSGLMVVAKDDVTHAALAKQFFERTIDRRYIAILLGTPSQSEARIETLLARDPRDRKRMAVSRRGGKRAATLYRVLESGGPLSVVEFKLETGRTHQIRVHASHMGHPVLADETYGGRAARGVGTERQFLRNQLGVMKRQALHAATLAFDHPVTGERLTFESDPPEDMQTVMARMRRIREAMIR
jgi:23S rRNA pseudouridine1911/1915/1917 synthase